MGFAENMRILSNINCGLASGVTYLEQRTNGVAPQYAAMNLFGNLTNGIARNEIAYGMQRFGNPVGNTINMYAGYGNPVSNAFGTYALMGAVSPWMFFNSPSYMFSPMPMGFYGGMGMGFGGFGSFGGFGMPWGSSISITTNNCHHHRHGFYC